jgi:phosphate transport system protein
MPSSHISREFETELRELRAHAIAMGARCERSLRLAIEAFWSGSDTLAAEVKALDGKIDRDEIDIDALVLRILALRQPVAYDLRLQMMALKLVTDLERIGDEAVNIAERAAEARGASKDSVSTELRAMADHAQQMLRDALDAFVEGDAIRAGHILKRDDAVDALYGEVMRAMMTYMRDHPQEILPALRVMKVAKYVESIADHATNIAEGVIFMVHGDDVRHRTHPPGAPVPVSEKGTKGGD